jgi:hypothetical protein
MGASDLTLVTEQSDDLVAESLAEQGVPERVNYATGVLLGAEDFAHEQLYLRSRMARAFAGLYGHGTVAGLRVGCATADNPSFEVQVAPGIALDRLGRLIEIRRTQCIRLVQWLAEKEALPASHPQRVAIVRGVRQVEPARSLLALDVFLRFAICPHGRTPAFAAGPFNATDYVVPSRLADAFELTLQLAHTVRANPNDANDMSTVWADPAPRSDRLDAMLAAMQDISDPQQLEAARRAWAVESALSSWPTAAEEDPSRLPKLREHARNEDWDKLLLARVLVPVRQASADAFPTLDMLIIESMGAGGDLADNGLRPIVFTPYSWRGAV